jgi:hypothetical protein
MPPTQPLLIDPQQLAERLRVAPIRLDLAFLLRLNKEHA